MDSFVAIDFETANFKRSSICSIGIAIVENGAITKTINRLVKPTPNYYEPINVSIHGITEKDTSNQLTFDRVWGELYEEIKGYPVVAHNASFDISALRAAYDESDIQDLHTQ